MKSNKNVVAIIVARMGSSRFPGKSLSKVGKKTMLGYIVDKLLNCKEVSDVVVSTSTSYKDELIHEWCVNNNVKCFRGSEDDVLHRIYATCKSYNVENGMLILGDNPLVDREIVEESVRLFQDNDFDFITTYSEEYRHKSESSKYFPVGVRVQIFTFKSLMRVLELATDVNHREHSTSFYIDNLNLFKYKFLEPVDSLVKFKLSGYNFAVNTEEQFNIISEFISIPRFNEDSVLSNAILAVKSAPNKYSAIKL
jgi:spore coat polysaccharide biosynthesis protein SpsF